jgi:hypothetical protein
MEAGTLVPAGTRLSAIVDGRDNVLDQSRATAGQSRFALQWGDHNTGQQRQTGPEQRSELVQISPGAMLTVRADSGAGNGSEFDAFGFEADPGKSGSRNNSPEPNGNGGRPPGAGNFGVQDQEGRNSAARLVQIGWNNEGRQRQSGALNESSVVQIGVANEADVVQTGQGLSAELIQNGTANSAQIVQTGAGNISRISQTGSGNTAHTKQ